MNEDGTQPKNAKVHVDRGSGQPLTFADTNGEPFLVYDAKASRFRKDRQTGQALPTGWVLHVEHYSPFVMSVDDPEAVDEAIDRAVRYLSSPLPNAMRLPGRTVTLQSETRQDGSRLSISATLERDGTLQITGHDLGPVTAGMNDRGEYEWFYTVAASDVAALAIVLGGQPDTDVIDLLQQRWSGDSANGLGEALRSSGVQYRFAAYP